MTIVYHQVNYKISVDYSVTDSCVTNQSASMHVFLWSKIRGKGSGAVRQTNEGGRNDWPVGEKVGYV